ncbi:hypothetical protein [Streptomyces sp. HPF1205]|uniref:hypothetical protein n=1 Tax=Streptomyces sp. HPF1205 TaxID=2873262 RepID=UPI001CEDFF96|nr:hypothetical protein [Streptomyces sp. HPF1205]
MRAIGVLALPPAAVPARAHEWPGPLRSLFAAGPPAAALAALVISPGVHMLLAAVLERRVPRPRQEFTALAYGDPLLAVACGLGVGLAGRGPGPAAHWMANPWGILVPAAGWLGYGLAQWRGEVRRGYYTPAQAGSPTKIWHQLGVYPLLWSVAGSAALAGLLAPGRHGGAGAGRWAAKAGIVLCVAAWSAFNVHDRRHPRLGHPPFAWRRLRPLPRPWAPDSTTLRAAAAEKGKKAFRKCDISAPPRGDMPRESGEYPDPAADRAPYA